MTLEAKSVVVESKEVGECAKARADYDAAKDVSIDTVEFTLQLPEVLEEADWKKKEPPTFKALAEAYDVNLKQIVFVEVRVASSRTTCSPRARAT